MQRSPFKRDEVVSRVQTHLKIEQLIQEKEGLNEKLQAQNDELIESQSQYRIILEKSSDGGFRFCFHSNQVMDDV